MRKASVIFEALQRFVSMPSGAPGGGSHSEPSLRVSAVDLQLAVRTTDASLFSRTRFEVIQVAKSRRDTRESSPRVLCVRGSVVREVGGRACGCLPVERRASRRKAALFDYQTTRSMLLTKMDLLNYQYLDKMNNNIGILCYEGKQAPLACSSGSVW